MALAGSSTNGLLVAPHTHNRNLDMLAPNPAGIGRG
jgi:hypothetical protein